MYIDFEYDGKRLSDYGCIICHIESDFDEYEDSSSTDLTFTDVKNSRSSIHMVTSSQYESVYSATFDIMKNPCVSGYSEGYNEDAIDGNYNNSFFSMQELEVLYTWLHRRKYCKFKLYSEDADDNVFYYGSFNIQKIRYGNHIIGLTLKFTANAPYGFGDKIEHKLMMYNPKSTSIIVGTSGEYGMIIPDVSIKCFIAGNITIKNKTTGTSITINNCVKDEIIFISGEYKIITTNNEDHEQTIADDYNYEYLDLIFDEYTMENVYSSTLPCELTIQYNPIRKVGVC